MNKKIFEELGDKDKSTQLNLFTTYQTEGIEILTGREGLEEFHKAVKEEVTQTLTAKILNEREYVIGADLAEGESKAAIYITKVSSNSDYTKMMKQKMIDSGNFKKVK